MLRRALVVGIAGWLCAQEPVPTPPAPAEAPATAPTPRAQAEQFVRELAEPGKQNAAVAGLVALGDAAVPALHKALLDRRSDVLQWALFACSGLHGDCSSLRTPVESLLASQDLGVALMARRAWPAVEGRNGVLLTLSNGNVVLVTDTNEKVLLKLPGAFHTELLPNGNLLTVSHTTGSIRELLPDGKEVWTLGGFQQAVDCKRLPDGNTLVCNHTGQTVVELKPDGSVAWSTETGGNPLGADRLANGNTLIVEFNQGGVIEVNRNGRTVWSFASPHLSSARRQLDGTTLVADRQTDRVRLVGSDGKVQRTWKCDGVLHAELLPNGHLVVNRNDTVLVLDDRALPLWVTERREIRGMQVLGAGPFRAHATPAEPEPKK
jgi:hypothetical protein